MPEPFWHYWGKARPASPGGPRYHLLPYHCLDVAAVGCAYLNQHPRLQSFFAESLGVSRRVVLDWLVYCLALHDLGKFAVTFQGQREDLLFELQQRTTIRPYTVRHDTLGAKATQWIRESRPDALGLGADAQRYRARLQPWFDAVTGHHGQPPEAIASSLLAHFETQDLAAAASFTDAARKLLLPEASLRSVLATEKQTHETQARHLSWWLAGVAVLSDWLGSNTAFFRYRSEIISLQDYWETAKEAAERALVSAGVLPAPAAVGRRLQNLFTGIHVLSPLQHWAETTILPADPQLYLLEDVTGAGKTEAALTLAYRLMAGDPSRADGAFLALPTMATADAMFERVITMANLMFAADSAPSCVLAHGHRHLSRIFQETVLPADHAEHDPRQRDETASARCAAWLADSNKKALLASVGVGTVDQALLGILPARHQSLRLLGLFGKVLIVDEVHACDAYMQELLERLLYFHAASGGSAILLSATLTKSMKQKLAAAYSAGAGWAVPQLRSDDYPLATCIHRSFDPSSDERKVETRDEVRRSVRIEYTTCKQQVLDCIRSELTARRCVCWIRNTVADAVEVWNQFASELPRGRCTLFHARYAMCDRLEIEKRVLETFGPASEGPSRHGHLVIATQVVEQSLDLDFDVVVSDLAPIDRLIQRSGRLQRHVRDVHGNRTAGGDGRGEPVLHVLGPEWSDNPADSWYREMFPGGAIVYPHHAQLWLTAKFLREGVFSMPEDARRLIEGVFGEQAEYPAGLQRTADRVEGENWAQTNFAAASALRLDRGYQRGGSSWHADDESPTAGIVDEWETVATTRSGESMTTVRLAKRVNGQVTPWCEIDGENAWDLSSLRAPKRLVAKSVIAESEQTNAGLPDEGRWSVLLVLTRQTDGAWTGEAEDVRGRRRVWVYDTTRGLREVPRANSAS